MASSAVSSVMGRPFNARSCFGFLSFAAVAGMAAMAGTSTPRDNTQAMDKNPANNALGRRQINAACVWRGFIRSSSLARLGFMPAPYKDNPGDAWKLHTMSNAALPEEALKLAFAEKSFAVSWVMFLRYKTHPSKNLRVEDPSRFF